MGSSRRGAAREGALILAMLMLVSMLLGYIPMPAGDGATAMQAASAQEAEPVKVFDTGGAVVYDTPGLALTVGGDTLPGRVVTKYDLQENCLQCHAGIEDISTIPAMRDLACTFCHGGDPEATTVEEAHVGIVRNPGDMRVVNKTCAICHPNVVEDLLKSLHSTMAGKISSARYGVGAQDTKYAIYGVVWVKDTDGNVPTDQGALHELKPLPYFDPNKEWGPENHPVDAYLRNQCLRCHIWVYGKEVYADYRSSGCSACHVVYDDDGLYKGGDPTVPKDEPGHPAYHQITRAPPSYQCVHCHNRGGRTGVSYLGMMEADPYGYPWSTVPGQKGGDKYHGKYYNFLHPDVHYQRGMHCVDCHQVQEIHGDGNIYSKKWQATAIECTTCHGTPWEYANFTTRYGQLNNIVQINGTWYLRSKVTGELHPIPQLKDLADQHQLSDMGYVAMVAIPQHMEKLECYACHATWAPQCYGCHVQADLSTPDKDWLTYNATAVDDPSQVAKQANRLMTTFKIRETRSFLRWERVPLGIGPEGQVSPFIPGCQDIWTIIGPNGEVIMHNDVFYTYDGYPSVAFAPIQPHTIQTQARTCAECHTDPKVLGLGDPVFDYKRSNLPVDITKFVDENGNQLLSINQPNSRPFNKTELQKILRVGTCLGCHYNYSDPAWQVIRNETGLALDPEQHIRAVMTVFTQAVLSLEGGTGEGGTVTKTVTTTTTITETVPAPGGAAGEGGAGAAGATAGQQPETGGTPTSMLVAAAFIVGVLAVYLATAFLRK